MGKVEVGDVAEGRYSGWAKEPSYREVLSLFSLVNQTAVVTGVGPGIGEHIVRGFAAAGSNVVLFARSGARIDAIARDIESGGGHALAVTGDVRNAKDIGHLRDLATERFGVVTILVNSAYGGMPDGPRESWLGLLEEDWRSGFETNLLAPYRLVQSFAPGMLEVGSGSVINILSTTAFTPVVGGQPAAYGATKAGLAMLTRYLAAECAPAIRVNSICPGTLDPDGGMRENWVKLLPRIPLRRIGTSDEIVGAAIYLASQAASYVTGQVMFVDGGRVNGAF